MRPELICGVYLYQFECVSLLHLDFDTQGFNLLSTRVLHGLSELSTNTHTYNSEPFTRGFHGTTYFVRGAVVTPEQAIQWT